MTDNIRQSHQAQSTEQCFCIDSVIAKLSLLENNSFHAIKFKAEFEQAKKQSSNMPAEAGQMAKTTALSMDRYQDCYLAVHIARILKHNGYETLNLCPQKDLVQQVTAKGIVDPVVISALTRENIDTAAVSKKLVDRSPNKASLTP